MDGESDEPGQPIDPLTIPAFLRRGQPQQESEMHNTGTQADLGTADATAAVRAEMEALAGETAAAPAEDMTIEEAQKRLSAMVKQRDTLDVGVKAYKKYITKKIAAL